MDKESGMPVGLTVMPGNVLDVTHFSETFGQIRPLLPQNAMIVFDNGAYSKENAAILDREGFGFVTRMQLNASDDAFVKRNADGWMPVDGGDGMTTDGMGYMRIDGSLGRKRYVFFSEERRNDAFMRYRRKAERDYEDMVNIRTSIEKNRKPRKKYRSSNVFVDTRLFYTFPLEGRTREEAVEEAVKRMITGREGQFVLLTNRSLTASETLSLYRSRNAAEAAFRDLKHGIDWRPARCTSPDAIKGRILISFLALFCMSMIRFLYPEFRTKTAGSISEELGSFSLTTEVSKDGKKRRIWSNFTSIIRHIFFRRRPVRVPKAPKQTTMEVFRQT
jgi:transposase